MDDGLNIGARLTLTPHDLNLNGQGIATHNGLVIFVDQALPGDVVEAELVQRKTHYAVARVIRRLADAPDRQAPFCPVFDRCGGCALQHWRYEKTCEWKDKQIRDALVRIGHFDPDALDAVRQPFAGMNQPFNYRNKIQLPVGGHIGHTEIGYYVRNSHRICDAETCCTGHPAADLVRQVCRAHFDRHRIEPYQEATHSGLVRHLLIRISHAHRQVMVCLVLREQAQLPLDDCIEQLKTALRPTGYALTGFVLNINPKRGNRILGETFITVDGEAHIREQLFDIVYDISPASFFQINTEQTHVLYQTVLDFADLKPTETAFDLYCGTGSITLQLAQHARRVLGNEWVEQAVVDARHNAQLNHMSHVTFEAGLAEVVAPIWQARGETADCMVVDPPRKGCDRALLETILKAMPPRVVYVSCNPATLARDLAILRDAGGYHLRAIKGVDLFPWTTHTEAVCLLARG